MKLSAFIEETLSEIAIGIASANRRLKSTGAIVNPPNMYIQNEGNSKIFAVWDKKALEMHPVVELIEFDVAISAGQDTETNANAGVSISIAKLGAGGKTRNKSDESSRVKFRIPFVYPRAGRSTDGAA